MTYDFMAIFSEVFENECVRDRPLPWKGISSWEHCNGLCYVQLCPGHLSRYVTSHPRPTQPSIPSGSVNEYQLWLGRQRQVWFIPLADERGVCLWDPWRTRAIGLPERLRCVHDEAVYNSTFTFTFRREDKILCMSDRHITDLDTVMCSWQTLCKIHGRPWLAWSLELA